ncbi:branched-chain amino acid ABC transporter substrate-binding protein [Ectobacillus sp. JY-23]|uniref:branched-chain amino acid ABC transporter substrate-binding protein n=1 Tax=Ectobacillus sp. JY-23 TaxID=2933872 RepID=UPI001FF2DAD3|nr:branched-chain amino acid ABC transporter substrate-binding protein [Ectobacillus sp. JY-23]UOY93210.1 branched-chain amino acid ABC transporter substrate-binding protein [Ectobacillus sp. JY-23]
MKRKKSISMMLAGVLMSGLLAGCGGNEKTSSTTTTGAKNDSKVIKIVSQSPLSGGSASFGESMKLGAQLAVEKQKEEFKKLGFDLQFVPYDDQGDPKKGVANAQTITADKAVFGVVGHLMSGVSIAASETYEKQNLVMVSPSSTAVDLTERGLKSVARLVARDDFQGPAAAKYAVDTLKAANIFIIQDKTAYGQGLADAFKKEAEKIGAKVVGYEGITIGEKDFNGVLNQVVAKKPDLVYFGGLYAEGSILVKQAREKGIKVPIMGGDGIDSPTMAEVAKDALKDTYYTTVATSPSTTEKGKAFVDDYKKKFNKDIEAFSAYGYDSAAVILQGIKEALQKNGGKMPTREQVRDAVRGVTSFDGVITNVSFDEKGDNKNAKVYIYKFEDGSYPGKQQGEVSK